MDLLGITVLYILLFLPIFWIFTYPVYWLNKKTKHRLNPFIISLRLELLGSSMSSFIRFLISGIYIFLFGALYCFVFFGTLMVTGNYIFLWFDI